MPRKARIDAPGALHHIICRGIEQTAIFRDDADRENFVERLGQVLSETDTPCYAWALIPMRPEQVQCSGKQPQLVKARSLLCFWAVKELEMSGADVAQKLKVCNSAVSRSVVRGEKTVADMKLRLIEY